MNKEELQQAVDDGLNRISVSDAELLIKSCKHTEAKNIVEVGSMYGGSTIILGSQAKTNNGKLTCFEPNIQPKLMENIKKYELEDNVEVIEYPSPWIPDVMIPRNIDLLFIDGDHRTRWVLADYHFFAPFVRVGGIICFHDWRYDLQCRNEVNNQVRTAVNIILDTEKLEFLEVGVPKDISAIAFIKKG